LTAVIKRLAIGVSPDYPNLSLADPIEELSAIAEAITKLSAENEDLLEIVGKQKSTIKRLRESVDGRSCRDAKTMRFYW
jgi:hypothetical protein